MPRNSSRDTPNRPPIPDELLEAAHALSRILKAARIPHAFCGGLWATLLCGNPGRTTRNIDCIVECKMKDCIKALKNNRRFIVPSGLVAHTVVVEFIPPPPANRPEFLKCSSSISSASNTTTVKMALFRSGEFGPKHLTEANTLRNDDGLVMLKPSEFIRTKVKDWMSRRKKEDADDIYYAMRTHRHLDFTRINPSGGLVQLAARDRRVRAFIRN